MNLASSITHYVNLHPQWGWAIAALFAAGECIAIVGLVIPGSIVLIILGSLIARDILPLWSTLIAGILGGALGTIISYWIGYAFKDRIDRMWPFSRYKVLLKLGHSFFLKHGGKSIFISRIGMLGCIIPVIAGGMGMNIKRFHIFAIISGILWGAASIGTGILVGKGASV